VNTDAVIDFIKQAILFYLVFTVFVIGIMIYMQNASRAALSWSSVQGKIKSSRIHYRRSYNKSDPTSWVEKPIRV